VVLDAAVKHSVEWQELFLDGKCSSSGSRRSSVSSFDSVLTELTDSEDDDQTPKGPLSSPFPIDVNTPNEARGSAGAASLASNRKLNHKGRRMKLHAAKQQMRKSMRAEGKKSVVSFEKALDGAAAHR
jgi:hypothetical protein